LESTLLNEDDNNIVAAFCWELTGCMALELLSTGPLGFMSVPDWRAEVFECMT